jgi:hypothetical protein
VNVFAGCGSVIIFVLFDPHDGTVKLAAFFVNFDATSLFFVLPGSDNSILGLPPTQCGDKNAGKR